MGICGGVPMMGPKTLATVRKELREQLSKSSGRKDPIKWLEESLAQSPKDGRVLESLWELLKEAPRPKRRPKKARPAKKR
jgi:hypothetical protein